MANEFIKVHSGSWPCHSQFQNQHFGDLLCLYHKVLCGEKLPMTDVLYFYM